jgi:hypothetical protein
MKYPCANSTCNNNANKPGEYCDSCKERNRNANRVVDMIYDPEHVRRQEQYNKHKHNEQYPKKDE